MIKKYLKYIAVGSLAMSSMTSCTDKIMDEINLNPNNPTEVPTSFVLTDVISRAAASVSSGDFGMYAALYVEHQVGIDGQFYNAETRLGQVTQSTTYNNAWNAAYTGLRDVADIIEHCSAGGREEGNYQMLGRALVLRAYYISVLTDVCGDVPFTEASDYKNYFTPNLDKQAQIYDDIFNILDEGIENLNKENSFEGQASAPGSQDVLYDRLNSRANPTASIDAWIKFAHGLKARAHMRLSHINPSEHSYQDVLDEVALSFTSANEEARFDYNGSTSYNPNFLFLNVRAYYGASQSLRDNMDDNDPRIGQFFIPNVYTRPDSPDYGKVIFAPNGMEDAAPAYNVYGISSYFLDATQPSYLMSYHELKFLEAEAKERMAAGSGAEAAKDAIRAAFGASKTSDVEDYISSITTFDVNRIMKEKYLSFFQAESLEAYNDMRRLEAMGETSYITLQHHDPSKFPLRYTYGAGDVNNNPNVSEAQGNGQFVFTDKVWWAGGNR
ncbi:SusD/RagB family nutrient-binding outer membrane lipoprotein [Flammeovirga sp. MY04]|uniref:SusD/RagB family nutrient-binding outer membrane lipoprotein n=1 Tax=Flammeovirga sp. MY04 TaxID=1191459 RepID=UPI0008063029|nr:SusD/RagB family nutrient-binding outer membrane lipoprotein [Flammeovirga sp. MY04]ANQ50705.1 SusD/RagB family nutrient-binding outer membrane lipoprotein [Flammeovirga sp. MY04]